MGTLASECPVRLCQNLSCAHALPLGTGRASLLREPWVLLQPHHLESHRTPLALLRARGGGRNSRPFALFWVAQATFFLTQS